MADKMIIDGVDVSGCVNYIDDVYADRCIPNVCSIGLWQRHYKNLENDCKMSCDCKDNPNCYYKQLKLKEGECERLNKDEERIYQCNKNIKKENAKLYNELQAEKEKVKELEEKLKKQNDEAVHLIEKLTCKIFELRTERENTKKLNKTVDSLLKVQHELAANCQKYTQALEEIKGIVAKYQNDYTVNNGVCLFTNEILQKYEVLDDI